jgi:hypothetical protein
MSRRIALPVDPFRASPPSRLVQPLERSKRVAFFDMTGGLAFECADIVHAVASIPNSLSNWFYRDKRSEAGKAFGC